MVMGEWNVWRVSWGPSSRHRDIGSCAESCGGTKESKRERQSLHAGLPSQGGQASSLRTSASSQAFGVPTPEQFTEGPCASHERAITAGRRDSPRKSATSV